MRRHAKASSAAPIQIASSPRARFGVASLALLGLLAFLGIGAPSASAVDTCPNVVFRTGPSAKLPECRAYELVSPRDTGGLVPTSASFFNQHDMFEHTTINAAGNSLYFNTQGGAIGDGPGSGINDYYRVNRTENGWVTSFEGVPGNWAQGTQWYGAPSPDLDYYVAVFSNRVDSYPSGVYLHTPQGFQYLAKGSLGEFSGIDGVGGHHLGPYETETRGITPGGQHIIFWTPHRLEPDAPAEGIKTIYDRSANGPTHVVSLLPGDVTPNADAGLLGLSPDGKDVVFQFPPSTSFWPNPVFPPGAWYVRHDNSVSYEVLRPEGVMPGKKLTCDGSPEGATLSYQWIRNGEPIGGGTNATYTVTEADEGTLIQCVVSAANGEGSTLSASAPRVVDPYVGKHPPMPSSPSGGTTGGVSIEGVRKVGETLSCAAGEWENNPTFTYQWFRNGDEIAGATSSAYTLVSADKEKAIQCRVKGTNADGTAVVFATAGLIGASIPNASANPTITNLTDPGNAPEAGDELSCSQGSWSGSPSFAFQWLSDGAEIAGATISTYTVEAADEGAIQCRVTATNGEGSTQAVSNRAFFGTPVPSGETHPFLETFGSAAQPSFSYASSVAVDQSNGDLLVVDAEAGTVSRFKPDGTADDFSALGTNVINETSEGPLAFPFLEARRRSSVQIAVDNSGTATQGNIYLATGTAGESRIDVFSSTGAFLGKIDQYKEGANATGSLTGFAERACGVAVDSSGNVYAGDSGGFVHKYVPSTGIPTAADNTANFSYSEACTLAAGVGPTAGFIFATSYGEGGGELAKLDSSTGEAKYTLASGVRTVSVDPSNGHVYALRESELKELDASGAGSASTVSVTALSGKGVAVRGSSSHVFVPKEGSANVSVYGPAAQAFTEPPEQTTRGSVSGTAAVGETLFCGKGDWTESPTITYQWLRNGAEIAGATGSSYTLAAEDLEKVIQCRLAATTPAGATVAIDATASGARYVGRDGPPFSGARMFGMHPAFAGAYGGHIFYADNFDNRPLNGEMVSDLYSYDIATQTTTMISPGTSNSAFVHVSNDGSHVYFASRSQINGEGVDGQPNLYLWRQSDQSPKLIATLTDQDLDAGPHGTGLVTWMVSQSAMKDFYTGRAQSHTESSADGSVLLFMAHSQLTSFDNTEASPADCGKPEIGGEGCLEIYRYDSNKDEITCVSCPPGSAPAQGDADMQFESEGDVKPRLLEIDTVVRNMTTDTKTVFFESKDGLVPSDGNGRIDVYRWNEESGLALISTGQDLSDSLLYGVTPSGSDVVLATEYNLVPWDENRGTRRLYDARVDGGFPPPESTVTEPCAGDICQGAPSAAPPTPGAASSSLNGTGNVAEVRCRKGQRRVSRKGKQLCKPRKHKHRKHRRASHTRRAAR